MKRATVTAVGFDVVCPHCWENQGSPETGSHIWTAQEVQEAGRPDTTPLVRHRIVACYFCKHDFALALPKRVAT